MRTILITGARAPVAVDLARAFAAAGYEVHLADSVPAYAAKLSRCVAAVHRLPPPRTDFSGFARVVRDLAARLDPVAIVPTCEEVFYLAAAGLGDRLLAPPLDALRRLHSKIAFAAHARALGLAAPDTWRIESRADLDALPLAPGELVFKPEFSRFATHTLIRPAPAELERIDPSPERPWAAQRFVEGEELCLWAFARSGSIVAAAAYRPLWRFGKAAAYGFEAVECPRAVEVARVIAADGALTGHLSFDLIATPDGGLAPLECNPRAVSGVHLFDASAALADAMLGDGAARPIDGLRYLAPAMALLGLPAALLGGRLRGFVDDVARGQDVIGRRGDRKPGLGAIADAARFTARALASRRSASGATTDDIEWNGEPIG